MNIFNRIANISIVLLTLSITGNYAFSENINKSKKPDTKQVINNDKSYGKFTIVSGDIFVSKNNTKVKATKNLSVEINDKIISGKNSKAEITFSDGSKLRIDHDTEIILSPISSKKDKYSFLKMLKGQIWANIINKGEGRFAVKANNSIFAVMGTAFDVKDSGDKTEMSVFNGSVGVTNNNDDSQIKERIKDLHLEIDDKRNSEINKDNSLAVHPIEKPVSLIEGPKQVSIEEWLEITKDQKITVNGNGEAFVSELTKTDDSWTKWNKDLDAKK